VAKEYDVVNLDSKVLNEQRQYHVLLPENYSKVSQHYPVIYRLDGAGNIPMMREVLGRLRDSDAAPDVIIVAIENTDRLRDMYPTVNQDKNGPIGMFVSFKKCGPNPILAILQNFKSDKSISEHIFLLLKHLF
jgi:predicted alpha/beta superfamily hydrolase